MLHVSYFNKTYLFHYYPRVFNHFLDSAMNLLHFIILTYYYDFISSERKRKSESSYVYKGIVYYFKDN